MKLSERKVVALSNVPHIEPAIHSPLNTVIGTPDLCAWQPDAGTTWVQTRSSKFANKLSRRRDSTLVAVGVAGGYLRIFKFTKSLAWARRLLRRYTTA
jgi:hypothetical protein